MNVVDLKVLCYDWLHLYQAPGSGLLLSNGVCWWALLATQSWLHWFQKQCVQTLSLCICNAANPNIKIRQADRDTGRQMHKSRHWPLDDLSDCSESLLSRFLSSCMDFPAMMICLRTGLRNDTMVSCLLLEPWSPPELPLAASFSFSSFSTVSDML